MNPGSPSPAGSTAAPLVGAFYYPRYGGEAADWRHWRNANQHAHFDPPRFLAADSEPVLGPYDSRDAGVVRRHLEWATAAGIDVFVVCYFGRDDFEREAIDVLMQAAGSTGVRVCFTIGAYPGRTPDTVIEDMDYFMSRYGRHPAFLDVGSQSDGPGAGLFLLWAAHVKHATFFPRMGGENVGPDYWKPVVDWLKSAWPGSLAISNPPFAFDDLTSPITSGGFDGLFNYTHPKATSHFKAWALSLPPGALYLPCVLPGYSAKRIGYHPSTYVPRGGGATLRQQWQAATSTGVHPYMVVITTFNEWNEGTQIEPGDGYDDRPDHYIELVRDLGDEMRAAARPDTSLPMLARWSLDPLSAEEFLSCLTPPVDIGEGIGVPTTVDGGGGVEMSDRYLYFWVWNDFHFGVEHDAQLELRWWGEGTGVLAIQYDAGGGAARPIYRSSDTVGVATDGWVTTRFELPGAVFSNRQKFGADFRIARSNSPNSRVVVAEVSLMRAPDAVALSPQARVRPTQRLRVWRWVRRAWRSARMAVSASIRWLK